MSTYMYVGIIHGSHASAIHISQAHFLNLFLRWQAHKIKRPCYNLFLVHNLHAQIVSDKKKHLLFNSDKTLFWSIDNRFRQNGHNQPLIQFRQAKMAIIGFR